MLSLSDLRTQSWMFGFVIPIINHVVAQGSLSPCVSNVHPPPPPLFPCIGNDDHFPVVAVERDTEGSEGEAVLSAGTGFEDILSLVSVHLKKPQDICCCHKNNVDVTLVS